MDKNVDGKKRITIKDVAMKAGVTSAVVSRVFNKDKTLNIREETRRAVDQAILELNYAPNSVARSLRMHSSNMIGVVIADVMNPFFTEIVKGIQLAAREAGYGIVLCDTGDNPEEEKEYIRILQSQFVEGIILGSSYVEDDVVRVFEKSDIKYVMVNRASANASAPYVRTNDIGGMMDMVEHLVQMGHTKIAHLSGPLFVDTAIRRLEGYRKGLKKAGIEYNSGYVLETKYDEESGYRACKELLKLEERPTAICAGNDMVAIGAMRAIKSEGLSIPEDISVAGYNDIWVAPLLAPSLTTMNTPLLEMGGITFRMLRDSIKGDLDVQKKITLEPELVVRESTGPVREK
ncbi:LacI family DNA-binding transcriptional regulator [Christensenella hongkongensis]|uniref:LacI family DNA-binding transcriptional regulator n=1 Tax=Christensenella hongkongensis TaxID=270498 RepID=UPI002671D023|nr:LacI family DNA-binding transcriptional regulator [Christensenella hongkongensis]